MNPQAMPTNYGTELAPRYGPPTAAERASGSARPPDGFSSPSAPTAKATQGAAAPLTLDRIVADGRLPVPSAEPTEAMIADRRRTQQLGLDDAITQLRWRYELYRRHMDELERAELTVLNAHHTPEDVLGIVDGRRDPELRRELDGIAQQRRAERLSLWRDLSRLRQAVPEWAERYLAAFRKAQLFSDGGDAA